MSSQYSLIGRILVGEIVFVLETNWDLYIYCEKQWSRTPTLEMRYSTDIWSILLFTFCSPYINSSGEDHSSRIIESWEVTRWQRRDFDFGKFLRPVYAATIPLFLAILYISHSSLLDLYKLEIIVLISSFKNIYHVEGLLSMLSQR